MPKEKIAAVVVAILMMATAGFTYAAYGQGESEATSDNYPMSLGAPTYNFYFAMEGSASVSNNSGDGYNAYIALVDAVSSLPQADLHADSNYTVTVDDYQTINSAYGTVTKLFGQQNGEKIWNVYMYNNQGEWVKGPVNALGFYQAFSDYDSSLRTANILLWYGTPGTAVDNLGITLPSTGLASITIVDNNLAYLVGFNISYDSDMACPSNVPPAAWSYMTSHTGTYYGYGSNAYLALCDALTSVEGIDEMYNITYNSLNTSAYGRVTSIMDVDQYDTLEVVVGDEYTTYTSTYYYWSLYEGDTPSSSSYASFNLGFYSPLTGLGPDFEIIEFSLVYCESVYSWQEPNV